ELYETSPSLIGDTASNLFNIRQRYALTPYLYSLAHRAWLYGDPLVAPLVYYYQEDFAVHGMASEKMLGYHLLVATVTEYGVTSTDVYLPPGTWINYHTGERYEMNPWHGDWIKDVPVVDENGIFRLPVFVRTGAILPQMFVDDQTANVLGQRRDGSTHDELILRVYPGYSPSEFTLYEDDGETIAYQSGDVRTTLIRQDFAEAKGNRLTIEAASGTYADAPAERDNVIVFYTGGAEYIMVTLNDEEIPRLNSQAEFDAADSGWVVIDNNYLAAKSGKQDVNSAKTFIFWLARG
ncbi:MAG: DUF5110 domain-containing protein, partial [Chloroflexi bacterium]|nr:DUF5110 domain-containing protein [Chloroflexota bacterium]